MDTTATSNPGVGGESTSSSTGNRLADALPDRSSVDRAAQTAHEAIDRVAAKAEELARRSADAVRDRSADIKERAVRTSDMTIGYIKDEPVKAILIAAATGAVLMALVSLLNRDRD